MAELCSDCRVLRPATAFQTVLRSGTVKTLKTCSTCRDWQAQEQQARKRVAFAPLSGFDDCITRQCVDNNANRQHFCSDCHSLLSAAGTCPTCSPCSTRQAQPAQLVQQSAALTTLIKFNLNICNNANQQHFCSDCHSLLFAAGTCLTCSLCSTRQAQPAQPVQQSAALTTLTESDLNIRANESVDGGSDDNNPVLE
jgi:hypothetical protein